MMNRTNLWRRLPRWFSSSSRASSDAKQLRDIEKLMKKTEIPSQSSISQTKSISSTIRPSTYWIDALKTHREGKKSEKDTLPEVQVDMKPRRMIDSFIRVKMDLTTDMQLLEQYINVWGEVRMGKILEDLDAIAGSIAYKHVFGSMDNNAKEGAIQLLNSKSSNVGIVTASLDKLQILRPFLNVTDLMLSGHVSYVGTSSMEVFVKLEDMLTNDESKTILLARFSMAARDSITGKAANIPPLVLENDQERALFSMAEEHKARKKAEASLSFDKSPPTAQEAAMMHSMYLESKKYDVNSAPQPGSFMTRRANDSVDAVWMSDTELSSCTIMQPQDRNVHNKIFGGYLLRLSFELAFANASAFINTKPLFIALDQVSFKRPVPIGSILLLTSKVLYSYGPPSSTFQVGVKAELYDVKGGKRGDTTNVFYFTFANKVKGQESNREIEIRPLRRIIPRTFAESLEWVEAYRRRELGKRLAQQYKQLQ